MISETNTQSDPNRSSAVHWQGFAQLVMLFGATCFLYRSVWVGLVGQWWSNQDYNYGFFVPLLSAAVLWRNRSKLRALPSEPSWTGLVVIVFALGVLVLGVLGAENFLARSSFLLLLAGLLIQFRGWKLFRAVLFPWAALFLMIPLPAIVFNQITLPLQFLASRLGTSLLQLATIPASREGNVIILPAITLDVAEACSGLRSLLTLVTVSVYYAYFFETKIWRRALLIACSIPIAILANGLRIMGSGLMGHYLGRDWAEGFYHLSSGVLVFLFSLLVLVLVRRMFVWSSGNGKSKIGEARA